MKRFWLGVGLFLVLLSSSFTVVNAFLGGVARAAGFSNLTVNANFIDNAHIEVTVSGTYTTDNGDKVDASALSGIYYDRNIRDNGLDGGNYAQGGDKKVGVSQGCQSSVFVPGFLTGSGSFPAAWTFKIPPKGTTATQCITETIGSKNKPSTTYTISSGPMGDGGRVDILYYVSDLTHINEVDNDPSYDSDESSKYTLTKIANGTNTIGNGDKFLYDKDSPQYGGQCPNYMQITGNQNANDVIPGKLYDQDNSGSGCKLTGGTGKPISYYILTNTPTQISQGNTNLPTTGGTDNGGDPNVALQDKCPLTQWWQLKWIACPIIESINDFINSISKQIQESLLIDINGWFGTGGNASAIKAAFNSFRALGLSVLIAAAIAMVASQASGFEALDALTVRRFMPQFVISVILISVLWPLEKAAMQIVNELSLWIPDAIYAPFLHIRNDLNAIDGWSLLTALLVGVGGLVALGPFGFLSFLLTAFFALIIAAITITLVKMALLGGLIAMPLALAFRPIPNMKFIWDFVIKIVQGACVFIILVPIAFALGKILAILLPSGGTGMQGHGVFGQFASIFFADAAGGFLRSLAVFACIIGPYFLIPKIAQMSGGAIANLAGIANDRGRGAFDRLKKYRQGTLQQRGQAWRSGSLYQNKGFVRARINNLGRRTALGYKGFTPRQGRALLSMQQAIDAEAAAKANPLLGQLAMDDDANAVLGLSGGDANQGRAIARRLFRVTDAQGNDLGYDSVRGDAAFKKAQAAGFQRNNSAYAFRSMMQNKARAVGAGDIGAIEIGARNLAGNNQDLFNSLMFEAAYNARGAGRNDLGGTSITQNDQSVLNLQRNALRSTGTAVNPEQARSYLTTMDGMARTTVGQMMNGHTNQARADTQAIQFMLRNGNEQQRIVAMQRANEIAKNLSQANGDSQAIFNDFIQQIGINQRDATPFATQLANRYNFAGSGASPDQLAVQVENGSRAFGNEAAYRAQAMGGGPTPPKAPGVP